MSLLNYASDLFDNYVSVHWGILRLLISLVILVEVWNLGLVCFFLMKDVARWNIWYTPRPNWGILLSVELILLNLRFVKALIYLFWCSIVWLLNSRTAIIGLLSSITNDVADMLRLKSNLLVWITAMTSLTFILHRYHALWFTVVISLPLNLMFALNHLIVSIVLVKMNDHRDCLRSTKEGWILKTHLVHLHGIFLIRIHVWPSWRAVSHIHVHSISTNFLILWLILIMDRLYLLLKLKLYLLMHLLLHHHIA